MVVAAVSWSSAKAGPASTVARVEIRAILRMVDMVVVLLQFGGETSSPGVFSIRGWKAGRLRLDRWQLHSGRFDCLQSNCACIIAMLLCTIRLYAIYLFPRRFPIYSAGES